MITRNSALRTQDSPSGQALTELTILMPLFFMLLAAVGTVGYMCYQGVKVQQAANLAARIQGQERVAGGTGLPTIYNWNGTDPFHSLPGDMDPTKVAGANAGSTQQGPTIDPQNFRQQDPLHGSVYWRYRDAVLKLFSTNEKQTLWVPPPDLGTYSDTVKVVRAVTPPNFFGLARSLGGPFLFKGIAYGGEDSFMYGLPRWGDTAANPNKAYWQQILHPGCNPQDPTCGY